MDHYASLGVSRTSEDVVIRAAYLALMRRYHPDGNPTPEAAARVRAITAAYGVLGDAASRHEYDRGLGLATRAPPPAPGPGLRAGPLAFAITIAALAALVWIISARSTPAPGGPAANASAAPHEPLAIVGSPTCLSPEARALSRAAVLRQANGLRQGNRPIVTLGRDAIMVRTAPALSMAGRVGGAIECGAAVTVLLPRGLVTQDGQPIVHGEAEFLLGRDARGEAMLVDLALDDRFLLALASVRRAAPVGDIASVERREDQPSAVASRTVAKAPIPAAAAPRRAITTNARPCTRRACDDGDVRELEAQLALFERQSLANADSRRRVALRDGRARFEERRARCTSPDCARGALLDRTVEIADIMRSRAAPSP